MKSLLRTTSIFAIVILLSLCFAAGVGEGSSLKANVQALKKSLGDKIKHIVVLMEENRSYDHLMGWYGRGDGLNGTEFNLRNVSNPSSEKIYANKKAPYINYCDPNHGTPATTFKLFGPDYMNYNRTNSTPRMDGFAQWEYDFDHSSKYCGVLDMFDTPNKLPVLSALADEYLLFDRFFASVPGPTWPNREFFMSATSAGLTETFPWFQNKPGKLYPQKTIFDQVAEAGAEWKLYYQDTPWELFMESLAHNTENLHSLGQFYEDCASGNLPSFSFINPRGGINITTGEGSNDDHPDHDVALAEAHYKNVYEAIRASPAWNETLFVLTFDEHGGFYDHVPPPHKDIPRPDDYPSFPDTWFNFDRLGIRIPTILISPWIKKGQIVTNPPEAQKPFPNSEYDLTSIIASSRKILTVLNNTGSLTKRDAWVATWEHVLDELDEPRTDCPKTLPNPPKPTLPPQVEARQPVNELQSHMMTVHAGLVGEKFPEHIQQQGQVGDWLQKRFNLHKEKTAAWKASKIAAKYDVVLAPYLTKGGGDGGLHEFWLVLHSDTEDKSLMTIYETWDKVEVCLDGGHGMKAGNNLTVTHCYPSGDPSKNRDRDQMWTLHADATLRPYHNASLCVTNEYFESKESNPRLYLAPCLQGAVQQHYLYIGKDWQYGDGILKWMMRDTTAVAKK